MKKRLYIISAVILCLSIVLCACDKHQKEPDITESESTSATHSETDKTQTQTVTYTDLNGYHVVSIVVPPTQERTHPPVPSRTQFDSYNVVTVPQSSSASKAPITLPKIEKTTSSAESVNTVTTALNINEKETVSEESNGLSVQFKSTPVRRGNDATIAVNGEAGKQYIIEVYRNDKDLLKSDKLTQQTANALGVISWTFETDNLNQGYRKIIIKEFNSDKYIQTSILIN